MNLLITGATASLGKSLAQTSIKTSGKDVKLFLVSRSHDTELQELTSDRVRYVSGVDFITVKPQDSIWSDMNAFFDSSFSWVHVAGDFWDHLPMLEVPTSRASNMMDSHYLTFYNTIQAVLPRMISKGGGKVITFTCNATPYHFPNMAIFTAAKSAVEATVKCLAHEHSKDNIVANAIALSSLQTDAVRESKPYGDFEHYLPLEEVSETVLETLSMKSNCMNGSVLNFWKYSESYYHKGYFERIKQI